MHAHDALNKPVRGLSERAESGAGPDSATTNQSLSRSTRARGILSRRTASRFLDTMRSDFGVLRAMLRGIPQSGTHAENLQSFYGTQADDYDRFRERLLQGRAELITRLRLALPRG